MQGTIGATANRDSGLSVGIFTLIATEVGGAFVNGTAEEVYKRYSVITYNYELFPTQCRALVIVGAMGAAAPTNFQKD